MATHEVTRPLALNVTALEIAQALQDVIVTAPVVDNLTTNDGSKALSAKMGKKLNDEKFPIANIASALGQDVDKVPSNKVVDDALNAINSEKIIKTKAKTLGNVSFPAHGYVQITDPLSTPTGYTLLSVVISGYGEFNSGTAGAMFVDADGGFITGPANSSATSVRLKYIFIKTTHLDAS